MFAVRGVGGVPCGCWCWAILAVGRGRWVVFTIGMGSWWAVFAIGMGSWWAVFIVCRGSVGADSGPLLSFVGAGLWGGAGTGPLSSGGHVADCDMATRFPSSLPRIDVAGCSIGDMAVIM